MKIKRICGIIVLDLKEVIALAKYNFGFDADGVLFDTEEFQLSEEIQSYVKEKFGYNLIDKTGYGIKAAYGCTSEEEIKIWIPFIIKYSLFFKARPWIKETIDALRKEGHKVYIITSKACALNKDIKGFMVKFLFELGLEFNGIHVDGIEYCSLENSEEDKKKACEKRDIRLMVEDKKENIAYLSRYIPVICMDTLNNEGEIFNEAVSRVQDGNTLYAEIMRRIASWENTENIFTRVQLKTKEEKQMMSLEERNAYYDALSDYYKSLPYHEKKSQYHDAAIRLIGALVSQVFRYKYHPQVIGREHLPNEKGYIYVCNHLCDKDMIFLLSELRNKLNQWRPLIKKEILEEAVGILFRIGDSVFVKRKNPKDRTLALQEMAKHLAHGKNVLIFPEGTYNKTDGNLKDFTGCSHVYLSQVFQKEIVNLAITKDYTKSPLLRIDEPYIVSRDVTIEEANDDSYERLSALVEKNKQLQKR